MATVIKSDVGCQVGSQPVLSDLVDLGGGITAHVLKTSTSSSSLATNVAGNVAAGVADAGNPVKIGGVYNSPEPTYVSGNRTDMQSDIHGNIIVNTMQLDPSNDGIGAAYVNSQSLNITTSGAGYVTGDVIGGIIPLTSVNFIAARRVALRTLQINDKGNVSPSFNIYFLRDTPSGGTYTDNAPLVWGAGDSANKVGQLKVTNGDYMSDASQSSVNYSDLLIKMQVASTTLYMLIVATDAYTLANGNITILAEFDQE